MHFVADELAKDFKPTFLSISRDQEAIWKKLFVESKPYSDYLKRLLIINEPDCLDRSQYQYQTMIDDFNLSQLKSKKYITATPRFSFEEHAEIQTQLFLMFDNFIPTDNIEYYDCNITFVIVTNFDSWELEDYGIRPWLVAGYINGILNKTKLTGIGTLYSMGAEEVVFSESIGGVVIRFVATHADDDADDGEKISRLYPE